MNKKRMLVIEDDFASQVLYLRTFEYLGYHVGVIADGFEAVHARASSPDLPEVMLIDVSLPGLSGFDVVNFIREKLHRDDLVLVIISANIIPPNHPIMRMVDAVVLKPISPYLLAEKVDYLLARREEEQQVATA